MKAAGYLRVSTDEQEASGLGLEAQREKITAYCNLYDLELVETIQDAGSGKNLKRPGLQKALSMLRKGEIEGIVISKLDRLTRSVRDMGELLESYFTDKYSLHVVEEKIDTGTAAGRMMVNILMSVAQWERETIGERTKAALKVKRKRGERTGGDIPFGFNCENGKLIESPQEQRIIRTMKSLREKGHSYQKIADALNDDGYLTKTGRAWKWHIVRKIYVRVANG